MASNQCKSQLKILKSIHLRRVHLQYVKNKVSHNKFTNDAETKDESYAESISLLKDITGGCRVVIFDHSESISTIDPPAYLYSAIRRRRPGQADESEDKRQPVSLPHYLQTTSLLIFIFKVQRVHVDQTPEAAARRVRTQTPEELAEELLKHRCQIINLWRTISHPTVYYPLALCDYRTVGYEKDLVPTTLKFPTRDGETFSVKYNPYQKWRYLRGTTLDDAVLFKW